MASTGYDRIRKKDAEGAALPLTELEQNMDKALHEVLAQKGSNQFVNSTVAARMHALSAAEVNMDGTKAIVLFVPYKLLSVFKMSHRRLVEELEKKFSGTHIIIIAQRKMLGKSYARSRASKGNKGPRPRSRTLTHVKEAILEDVVYPTEILGKRTVYRRDGSKQIKVLLDPVEQVRAETKLDTFQAVYKKLTALSVSFEFAQNK